LKKWDAAERVLTGPAWGFAALRRCGLQGNFVTLSSRFSVHFFHGGLVICHDA